MDGDDYSTCKALFLSTFQRRFQIVELCVCEVRVRTAFGGNDPRVLQTVAVKSKDPHKGRFQGEVDSGLDLRSTHESARLGCAVRRLLARTEILKERLERGRRDIGSDHAIVITWDRENWRGVIPVRIIELVVVICGFSKAVDHVAQMVEEGRYVPRICFAKVGDHFIGDESLILWTFDIASVTCDVKDDLTRLFDLGHDLGTLATDCLR